MYSSLLKFTFTTNKQITARMLVLPLRGKIRRFVGQTMVSVWVAVMLYFATFHDSFIFKVHVTSYPVSPAWDNIFLVTRSLSGTMRLSRDPKSSCTITQRIKLRRRWKRHRTSKMRHKMHFFSIRMLVVIYYLPDGLWGPGSFIKVLS